MVATKFNKKACPDNLPLWDDGINSAPIKQDFKDIIKAAAKNADIVMFGDSDHFNPNLRGIMGQDGNLKALKEAGFTHIKLEVPSTMQHWVDKFNDGQLTRTEFEQKIDRALFIAQGNEDGKWTRQIGKMAEFARDNNIKLEFADPKNGHGECSEDLKGAELDACEINVKRDRYNDTQLSESHSRDLTGTPNAKIFQIYGLAHYSVDYSNREKIDGKIVKIDVYQNRQQYDSDKETAKDPNSLESKMGWGKVKPDLIYMIDERNAFTTNTTSPNLAREIAPKEKNIVQPVITPSTSTQLASAIK